MNADNAEENSNLLKNGSFELEQTIASQAQPVAWKFVNLTNAYTGVYGEGECLKAHFGSNTVGIISGGTSANEFATWRSDMIEVTPGSTYLVTGWIKTAECVGEGAWIWIYGHDNPKGEMLAVGKPLTPIQKFIGTQDWQKWSVEIQVPKNIELLVVACRLDGEGKAWFDDVSVSLVK